MALQSQLFRGDSRLEAAAVADAGHITPGASGPHVGKIQQALITLDGASLDPDARYGPATAAAVLAYKQKRGIINRSRQTQADNIVGIMTMAALDKEMLTKESRPTGPIEIRPVTPAPRGGRPIVRLGFKIDLDFPVFPGGQLLKIRLASRTTGQLEILNGGGGRVRCRNVTRSEGKVSLIFDPNEPGFIPSSRLIPGPQGPSSKEPLADGGAIRVTDATFSISIDGFHPGNAFIDATTGSSASTLAIEVRAARLVSPGGFAPPKKTRPGSQFISADDSEPGPRGFRKDNGGRPVGPKGTGRKINLFGSQETPGFEDYTPDMHFSGFVPGKFPLTSDASTIFRPFTEDTDTAIGIKQGEASDICLRDSPVPPATVAVIRRIAASGCRLTVVTTEESGKIAFPALKIAFPGSNIREESRDAIVMELP
jgi:hypothetical protein